MNKLGRPKEKTLEDNPKKFTREFHQKDGRVSIWKYDMDKFINGPSSIEIKYPPGYKCDAEIEDELPITKRTFWNPETETFVGYGRAKQLGLI
jgi:hypothetical protein